VSKALLDAAKQQPGTVRELAQRACVGFSVAAPSVCRLLKAGDLVQLQEERPMIVAARPDDEPAGDCDRSVFLILAQSLRPTRIQSDEQ
jgi:hypothetical protein